MKEKIIVMLNELNEDFKNYQGEDLLKDHILDSFAIMELIAKIEDTYEIEIDADDILAEHFKTADGILELVEKYTGNRI